MSVDPPFSPLFSFKARLELKAKGKERTGGAWRERRVQGGEGTEGVERGSDVG